MLVEKYVINYFTLKIINFRKCGKRLDKKIGDLN